MKSQTLVVDCVRNWHELKDDHQFITKELDICNVSVISADVEFEGTEEFRAVLLWDEIEEKPKASGERNEKHEALFAIIKRFAVGVNAKIFSVVHDRRTTLVKLKTSEPKNVEAFEWLDINLEEHKHVD